MAASGDLPDVDLVGVDFNPALVAEATRLAAEESLPCRFLVADAFALPEDATVYLSNGVLHHIAPADLPAFFAAQDRPGTRAFLHYDIAPTRLAPFGAWVFHRARMRAPLGRHDGVASARRAHPDPLLFTAASSAGMPTFRYGPLRHSNPFAAGMRAIIGTRDPALFQDALGRRARGLVPA
ncbi:class I SAM-dependent methyltransferase [Actinokineospora soli]|uniref:Class I SAM-dependent methyltransferase n=1 Tax=Actinokineospora soli TaxID=1048753 RepID=A0ABW2TWM8_9PSEU